MFVTKKHLPRRTFLRGMGVSLALPLLDSMIPARTLLAQTAADDLVFLFANHQVLDFYPRFGFRRAREWLFRAEHHALPAGTPLRTLDLDSADDRALLRRVAARAEPVTTLFGARNLTLARAGSLLPSGLLNAPQYKPANTT